MVYFEFWWSWFWFGRKFRVKGAKSGQFCVLLDTPMPRRRNAHLDVVLHFLVRLGVVVLRLGVALLHLDVPTSPVLVPLFR